MKSVASLMDHVTAYRLWQAPFVKQKLAPLRQYNDWGSIRSVLDVGCGPGVNTRHFGHADYLGIDLSPQYLAYARRRYQREFVVADASRFALSVDVRFDFILLNSLLHHVDDLRAACILAHARTLLSSDGHVHILDLVLPSTPGVARQLAAWDRGGYPRALAAWQALFIRHFQPVVFQPYAISMGGIVLWHMVYFKGRSVA